MEQTMRVPRTPRQSDASQPLWLFGRRVCLPPLLRDWFPRDVERLYRVARLWEDEETDVRAYDGSALLNFLALRFRSLELDRTATLTLMLVKISQKFAKIAALGRTKVDAIANKHLMPANRYPDRCLAVLYIFHDTNPGFCDDIFTDLSDLLKGFASGICSHHMDHYSTGNDLKRMFVMNCYTRDCEDITFVDSEPESS